MRRRAGPRNGVARRRAAAALTSALAGAFMGGVQAQDTAPGAAWQIELHSDRHSDALPLAAFDRDAWDALSPRRGRNLITVDDALRLSRRQGAWTWGLVARSSATLVAGEQALRLAADINAGRRPAGDEATQVDVRLRGFTGAGLVLGRAHALGAGWQATWEVQALSLGRWLERRFEGPVQYLAATGTYGFALRSSELDSRLDFPFRRDFAARGTGLLLAGALAWEGEFAWVRAGLRDGGWLRWRGVPQQDATLNTATRAVDGDGFLVYQPLIEGRNTQTARQRRQPWRSVLAAGARLPNGQQPGLRLEHVPGFGVLPAFTWAWPAAAPGGLSLGAQWQVHERRLGVAVGWRGFVLRAGADRLDAAARSREFAFGYVGAF